MGREEQRLQEGAAAGEVGNGSGFVVCCKSITAALSEDGEEEEWGE